MKKMIGLLMLLGISNLNLHGMLDPKAALALRIEQERYENPEALLCAVNCRNNPEGRLLLERAICDRKPESAELMQMLMRNGVNVNGRVEECGSTPFQLLLDSDLAMWLKINKMKILINGGVDVDFDYFAQWRKIEESYGRPSEDFERLEQAMRIAVAQREAE